MVRVERAWAYWPFVVIGPAMSNEPSLRNVYVAGTGGPEGRARISCRTGSRMLAVGHAGAAGEDGRRGATAAATGGANGLAPMIDTSGDAASTGAATFLPPRITSVLTSRTPTERGRRGPPHAVASTA